MPLLLFWGIFFSNYCKVPKLPFPRKIKDMDEEQYMVERVDDQIDWYDKKSGYYQRQFKQIRIWQIIFAAVIPFLSAFAQHLCIQITIGLLGVIVATLAALDGLLKPQQIWLEYRTTAETLKHQKYLYQTKTVPYDVEENAFNIFVEVIENIISKENSRWAQQISQKKAEKEKK